MEYNDWEVTNIKAKIAYEIRLSLIFTYILSILSVAIMIALFSMGIIEYRKLSSIHGLYLSFNR
jgi:hypothetical protein